LSSCTRFLKSSTVLQPSRDTLPVTRPARCTFAIVHVRDSFAKPSKGAHNSTQSKAPSFVLDHIWGACVGVCASTLNVVLAPGSHCLDHVENGIAANDCKIARRGTGFAFAENRTQICTATGADECLYSKIACTRLHSSNTQHMTFAWRTAPLSNGTRSSVYLTHQPQTRKTLPQHHPTQPHAKTECILCTRALGIQCCHTLVPHQQLNLKCRPRHVMLATTG
jgi:hypothetical protein